MIPYRGIYEPTSYEIPVSYTHLLYEILLHARQSARLRSACGADAESEIEVYKRIVRAERELNGREHEKHYEYEIRGAVYGTAQSELCARAFKLVFQPWYDRRGEEHREDQRDEEHGAYARLLKEYGGRNRVAAVKPGRAEHRSDKGERIGNAVAAEDHPSAYDHEHRINVRYDAGFLEQLPKKKFLDDEKHSEIESPCDVMPCGTVPKSREKPYDKNITQPFYN